MPVTGNPPLPSFPLTLATAYKRWHGWRDAVIGKLAPSKRTRICAHARRSIPYAGRMHYTEGPGRSELFHRPPDKYEQASSDCSQFVSAIAHWSGVKTVTDEDWTGTLYEKGKQLERPVPGCIVIFGAKPGVHTAVMTTRTMTLGFGDQAGPQRVSLAGMVAYFTQQGHAGHVFRDLTT